MEVRGGLSELIPIIVPMVYSKVIGFQAYKLKDLGLGFRDPIQLITP